MNASFSTVLTMAPTQNGFSMASADGMRELTFDEIEMVGGALDGVAVAKAAFVGFISGGVGGAAGGAAAGALAGGVGALPGAFAGMVGGAVGGAVTGAVVSIVSQSIK